MDTSFVASEESPTVYKIRFMPSELTHLYHQILPNVSVTEVYDCLCKYVSSSIEPIGWHAIWRTVPNSDANGLSIQYDFEVEVIDVLHNRLEAIGVVLRQINPKECQLTAEQFDEKERLLKETKIVNIPLTQLYVISDGDEDEQFHRNAVIIEQIRFFYSNLWRPWDELASNSAEEVFIESKLKPRLELSFDIKDKIIPQSTVNRIKKLLSEAWSIRHKLESMDKGFDPKLDISIEDNSEVDYINESELLETMKLKLRLEDIEREMALLEDKHLRIIAASLKKSNDTNGADDDSKQNKIHLIAKSFTIKSSKDILISLSNVISDTESPVLFHTSLGQAVSCAKSGDKIYLMPGLYSCPSLPWIENDLEIIGFSRTRGEVVIEPKDSVGDIFLNCSANKVQFSGLTFRATSELQCLLMIHNGFVRLADCVVDGADSTRNGLIALSKAKVEIENCAFVKQTENAIIARKGSLVVNRDADRRADRTEEQRQVQQRNETPIDLTIDLTLNTP